MTEGTLVISLRGLPTHGRRVIGSLYADGRLPLDRDEGLVRRVHADADGGSAVLRFDGVPPGHYAVVYELAEDDASDLQFAALHFDGADRSIALRAFAA